MLTHAMNFFLSSAMAELADRPLNMLMTLFTALSSPMSGTGEFCLELGGVVKNLGVDERCPLLGEGGEFCDVLRSSAGDKMICLSFMLEAASASNFAETSLSGDALRREWECPCTSWDWKIINRTY